MTSGSGKLAVVLFNLGGPDRQEAVRPFLFNLFKDPAIIGLPAPMRQLVAFLISTLRYKSAQKNYALMGGGSPILPQTEAQRAALESALGELVPDREIRCFTAMRYWHPFVEAVAGEVAAWQPDLVVLLPLYPQFSTTTTGSSFDAWKACFSGKAPTTEICCFPDEPGFVSANVAAIRSAVAQLPTGTRYRVLFSAHGLPEKIISAGDPYVEQVWRSVDACMEKLGQDIDHMVCFQSRVGPMKWVGPSTVDAIKAAGEAGLAVVVCPIAFVSEHIETLVELDIEYRELAEHAGCPAFARAQTAGTDPGFISGLSHLVAAHLQDRCVRSGTDFRCSATHARCPWREGSDR